NPGIPRPFESFPFILIFSTYFSLPDTKTIYGVSPCVRQPFNFRDVGAHIIGYPLKDHSVYTGTHILNLLKQI
ncbi:MAG: hypothetical protein AAF902_03335, partial [Chloroflexota bacterium]